MKVPSLEDMIQQQVVEKALEESYICLVCHRPLRRHHLIEDLRFPKTDMILLCDARDPSLRFKSTISLAKMADTLSLMLAEQWDKPQRQRATGNGPCWVRSGSEVVWIT